MMTKILIGDLETTVKRIDGRIDNSPYNPTNRLVAAGWGFLGWDGLEDYQHSIYYHNECITPDSVDAFQSALDEADVAVFHNAKFDVSWLLEMGFRIPDKIVCTMNAEYLLAKGQRMKLSLKETALRRELTNIKKSDLVDEMFRQGTGFESMPLDTVTEYLEADIRTTAELYLRQQDDFQAEENKSLLTAVDQMNDMLMFLVEIERNGCQIDLEVLAKVEDDFVKEKAELTSRLNEIVQDVMGDTPINLNSGVDMTKVIYSREVKDRLAHIQTWNIGTNESGKSLRPPRMSSGQFIDAVRATTQIVKKTMAVQCKDCGGVGSIQKYKKITRQKNGKKYYLTGDPYKTRSKCPNCEGIGAVYVSTGVTAGLKMSPTSPVDASINGFKSDKETIKALIQQAERKKDSLAVEFLIKLSRLSAISTYLDSFVAGLKRGTRADGILHANFNQCIAATGRLSSSNPNAQNWPKRGFPVRASIVSRFDGGLLLEADYSSLEMVVACELARDGQGIADILEGKDIHRQTASIVNQKPPKEVTKVERQGAKAYTFLPLFGGTGNGELPHIKAYFDRFYTLYEGIKVWHDSLMRGTLKNGIVQTPSGRQYYWPNVVRTRGGRVSFATQILNYPVQGFAADIVQIACIRALRLFRQQNLRSKIILTVHDSLVSDTHPDEIDQVKAILTTAMTEVGEELESRFNYKAVVPLKIEISRGKNWLDQEEYT